MDNKSFGNEHSNLRMRPRLGNSGAYAVLLTAQTVAAMYLFWVVYPIFSRLLTHVGEYQELRISSQIAILGGVTLLHCSYWTRLKWVSVTPPFHSIFLSHLCSFVGRVSFLFSGALFSAIFFRHLPQLDFLPPFGQTLVKILCVAGILFSFFCYSLELERLGKAIGEPPQKAEH
ncbi:hypothetical protein FHS21_006094 [Phyllobacterium trifolii]|uniref:Uncharacterized protein n=1 Tax=Phyllobacterium trifolii TaxID=300193 RepID=A0A839UL95_9HYPH|nr:hypothetical protein [Phyllobacterium trifolii]MBB3149640.1 hypothetical protein [Phyllobacterium trifolii]